MRSRRRACGASTAAVFQTPPSSLLRHLCIEAGAYSAAGHFRAHARRSFLGPACCLPQGRLTQHGSAASCSGAKLRVKSLHVLLHGTESLHVRSRLQLGNLRLRAEPACAHAGSAAKLAAKDFHDINSSPLPSDLLRPAPRRPAPTRRENTTTVQFAANCVRSRTLAPQCGGAVRLRSPGRTRARARHLPHSLTHSAPVPADAPRTTRTPPREIRADLF